MVRWFDRNVDTLSIKLHISGTGSRVITNIQPAVYQPSLPDHRQDGPCRTEGGVGYFIGQRWIRSQGANRLICTCLGNGVSCDPWGRRTPPARLSGIVPFFFQGTPRFGGKLRWVSRHVCASVIFPQMGRLQYTAATPMANPACFPSSTRGRPTTPAPPLDAATDSSGAPPPPTLRPTRNIPSAQKRMVRENGVVKGHVVSRLCCIGKNTFLASSISVKPN